MLICQLFHMNHQETSWHWTNGTSFLGNTCLASVWALTATVQNENGVASGTSGDLEKLQFLYWAILLYLSSVKPNAIRAVRHVMWEITLKVKIILNIVRPMCQGAHTYNHYKFLVLVDSWRCLTSHRRRKIAVLISNEKFVSITLNQVKSIRSK